MNSPINNEILVVAPSGYETVIRLENLAGDYTECSSVYYQGGGHGGNIAFYLSNLHVSCALFTQWGDDLPGLKAKETMLEAGVDISLCRVFPGKTSQSNFLINIGPVKKTIMNFGTALAVQGGHVILPDMPKALYTSLLPVSPAFNLIKNVSKAPVEVVLGLQIPTSVTKSLGLTHEILEQGLSYADHAIGSYSVAAEEFATDLKPAQLVKWLQSQFPNLKTVVLTDGKRGSYAYAQGELLHQPAILVEEMDSTGAGDQFIAVFLKDYILSGVPLAAALERAAFYSALVSEKPGARVLVTDEDIDCLRKEQGFD
ncbi:MAG: carbohydrate kinase family protein [Clostridia bacterium]|jgi:fructoselysine 6-kinase|nr:carbohydrate kinase family protein [Clostridia bacterium]